MCVERKEESKRKVVLDASASAINHISIRSVPISSSDAIVMVTDGVHENLPEEKYFSIIYDLTGKDKNKAKVIVEMATIMALGVGLTPFASRAAQQGFIIEGGRPDDASAIVITLHQFYSVNNAN